MMRMKLLYLSPFRVAEIVGLPPKLTLSRIISSESVVPTKFPQKKDTVGTKTRFLALQGPFEGLFGPSKPILNGKFLSPCQ